MIEPRQRRRVPSLLWALTVTLLALAALPAGPAWAEDDHQAMVVVRTGEGEAETRCVTFAEPTISGLDLLTRAGFSPVTSPQALGQAVCAIGDVGCPATDCFCDCRGADCTYWSYWHWDQGDQGEWRYAGLGAGAVDVASGGVDGWSWGPGSVSDAVPPPAPDPAAVCSPTAPPSSAMGSDEVTGSSLSGYLLFGGIVVLLAGLLAWRRGGAA